MAMQVLVTGGDTELGRTIAEGFRDAGHQVVITGARRDDLEVAAKELDVDAVVCDNTDPASLEQARDLIPHHVDAVVNVPTPVWPTGDPRTYTLADLANAWRSALDATMLSAVLTVQIVGDHLRSGGSIVNVVPENPRDGSAEAAIKAALSNWTAGQATHFGTRGITVNTVASGRGATPGYDGLGGTPAPVASEIARLALFLSTRPPGTSPGRPCTSATAHWPISASALTSMG
jgi:NAD(P)-dependent dehydrogenase (short-subunit alcohol dehydrogenase family)